MAEPYLAELRNLVGRTKACQNAAGNIRCKHFFSGAAAYVEGQIFMSLTPVGLALKLPESDRTALFEQGGKTLQYFPKAPVKKDYAVLPAHYVDDGEMLNLWIARGLEFALSAKGEY